jgi:serine/threonine protein kinase
MIAPRPRQGAFAPPRFATYAWAPELAPAHAGQEPTMLPLAAPKPSSALFAEYEALLPARSRQFLDRLGQLGLLDRHDREVFLLARRDRLRDYASDDKLGNALVHARLLTLFQLERVLSGQTHGLRLGNYRVLEELGKGGMGTVYRAEHRLMKREVAVKVLPVDDDCPDAVKQRFYSEMRVVAELYHPNITLALDAGELAGTRESPPWIYLVMELVDGGDLEKHVVKHGVCRLREACDYARQAAAGLQAAHDRHLVHRDVKPSNLLLTAAKQVKLVDFGLARQFSSRLTDQRALLGSVDFMPPEQSHDPSLVGKQADVYGLGATLFWLLAGEGPYPYQRHLGHALRTLQQEEPRRLSSLRADVPPELDDLVARMLDRDPAKRPASPLAVGNALRPFVEDHAGPLGGDDIVEVASLADAAPDRAAQLAEQLQHLTRQLEQSLHARSEDLREAHNALLFAMARFAESRDGETPGHLRRMRRYTRALALEAAKAPPWLGLVDARFLEQLERCVPLHDIGKIGLPDDILLKPASLSPSERHQVQAHPVIGDQILESLGREYGAALDFLGMARVIVRHHHERFDGKGYPDGLAGDAIPPAARLVAIADVYDALRRIRLYKPAMTHKAAVHLMLKRSEGQFDPELLEAFSRCHGEFERIYDEVEE